MLGFGFYFYKILSSFAIRGLIIGHPQCMHAKPAPLPILSLAWVASRAAVRASSGKQGAHSDSRPGSMGNGEIINLS